MKILKKSPAIFLAQAALAVVVFVSRIGVLPFNYSPLGSFGFLSRNVFLYFGIILAFDYFVGGFYTGVYWTYLGFASYYICGILAGKRTRKQFFLLPLSSFLFFLFSNFGSFLGWYPHTIEGFLECYTAALPFFKNTLIGDIGFGYSFILLKELALDSDMPFIKRYIHKSG